MRRVFALLMVLSALALSACTEGETEPTATPSPTTVASPTLAAATPTPKPTVVRTATPKASSTVAAAATPSATPKPVAVRGIQATTPEQQTYLEELSTGEKHDNGFGKKNCVFIPSVGLEDCEVWVRPEGVEDSWGFAPGASGSSNIIENCGYAAEILGSKWVSGDDTRVYYTFYNVWCGPLPECVKYELTGEYYLELCGSVLRDTRFQQGFDLDANGDGLRDNCDALWSTLTSLIGAGAVPDAFYTLYNRQCG